MGIGTGIFLGSLVFAFVYLYIHTIDRWKWRKIILWMAGVILIPPVAFLAWLWLASYRQAALDKANEKVSYAGIAIGTSRQEVIAKLGAPVVVLECDSSSNFPGREVHFGIPDGRSAADFCGWQYSNTGNLTVNFSTTTDNVVQLECMREDCPPLKGVHIDDREENVIRQLGAPSSRDFNEHSKVTTLTYKGLNSEFLFQNGRVYLVIFGLDPP